MDKNLRTAAAEKPAAKSATSPTMARTIRETVESIVIAFVLAFLFRTFEAEAFVIPTGSMAPTLQGRHKDVVCPECGYQYRVGARGEQEDRNSELRMQRSVCPMCFYELELGKLIPEDPRTYQTFEGDRILVNKFSYDLAEPKRWDVVVFKYPEDAKTNYIKRLAGLPGEHIFIGLPGDGYRVPFSGTGDIYVSSGGDNERHIARKETPEKLLAVLQDVYDNDYVATSLLEHGWPSRWQNAAAAREGAWTAEDDTRVFSCTGSANREVWLRYHHLIPRGGTWNASDLEQGAARVPYQESLIRDFYAYNTGDYQNNHRVSHGQNWVGDLAIECEAKIESDTGELVIELVKGGRIFQARIDVKSGDAKLVIPGLASYNPTAKEVIHAAGTYRLRFANIDEQLWLFVDDKLVDFDAKTTYDSLNNYQEVADPRASPFGATDYLPAGFATKGADVRISHLRIKRDVFYTIGDDARNEIQLKDEDDDEKDQFFMLGDNSPASKDGRLWGDVDWVERRLLIGKAVYIYWPHGIPTSFSFEVPVFGSKKYIPFWPNFARMHRVR